jgi:hypothetical protein
MSTDLADRAVQHFAPCMPRELFPISNPSTEWVPLPGWTFRRSTWVPALHYVLVLPLCSLSGLPLGIDAFSCTAGRETSFFTPPGL